MCLDATHLCNNPLVYVTIVLGTEEASVSTLWLQMTEMQPRILQEKLYLESSELGEASGTSGSRTYRCPQDLVSSISKFCSYLGFSTGSTTMARLPSMQNYVSKNSD